MANLDPAGPAGISTGSMFEACHEAGATVVYSSHAVAELERVCDYLIVLRTGRSTARRRYRRAALAAPAVIRGGRTAGSTAAGR